MHMSRSAGHEASASLPPLPLCEHLSTVPVPGAGSEVPAQTCLRRNDGPSEQFTCLRIPPTLSTRTNVPAEKTPPPRYTNERACEIKTSPRYTNERACEETAPRVIVTNVPMERRRPRVNNFGACEYRHLRVHDRRPCLLLVKHQGVHINKSCVLRS